MGAKQIRAFVWTCLFFVAFGALDVAAPLDDAMRAARNRAREQPASGKFILVLPDDPAQPGSSDWTWSRIKLAGLVADVRRAGAQRVAISRLIVEKPDNNDRLAAELEAMPQRSLIGMIFDVNPETGERRATLPAQDLLKVADPALANQYYDPFGRVHETPLRVEANGKQYRGLAAQMAGRDGAQGSMARIDYAFDLNSVPIATLHDISNHITGGRLQGRTVLIASADERMNAEWRGRAPSAYAHIIGAETLLHGKPIDIGWVPAFLVALGFAAIVWTGHRRIAAIAAGLATIALVFLPLLLERELIFPQTITGLLLVFAIAAIRLYRYFRLASARENALSGLPNLVALRDRALRPGQAVIVAKMLNYAELVSVVTTQEKNLTQMIGARLSAGGDQTLFHGDGGVFAWISPAESLESIGDHLDALHAFFLKPITVGSWQVDVSVTFGVDIAANDDVATCFARASVAADEAGNRGMRWAFYDSARLDQAEWNVSLLGKLDAAIESGEVWVAYQPKIDLVTARVTGFEALVRWTHPERGPISPEQFVSVAESHGRIDRLTYFVLDDALEMIASLQPADSNLGVAVNISAKMFGRSDFIPKVRSALKRHGIAPSRLTMEVTESAAAESEKDLLSCVAAMIKMGVQVSIDDYGTGYSTLEYLKKLKAHELKIDRGFIAGMAHNRSDFLLVKATIDLAHNLGHRVVAEGVETAESLEMLSKLGCDVAQGFLIAKPMPKQELPNFLNTTETRRAA